MGRINSLNLNLYLLTRKTSQLIEVSNPDVDEYLRKNKLLLSYLILNQSVTTLIGRSMLLKEKAQQYRNFILSYETPEEIVTYDMVKMQLMFLDLLGNIFMLLEDFLGHSYHLRTSLKEFPKGIASINKKVAENEIYFLKQLKKKEMFSYLLLPDKSSLRIDRKQVSLVRKNFANITSRNYKRIKNIVRFYFRYYRVYIKYKHILPAVLGVYRKTYDPNLGKNIVASDIFIRDYKLTKGRSKRNRYSTYVIHCTGLNSLSYLEDAVDDIRNVFEILLLSYINSISNLRKPFLTPVFNYVNDEDKLEWEKIISKVNKFSILLPESKIIININEPLRKKMDKALAKESIFTLRRDLFTI